MKLSSFLTLSLLIAVFGAGASHPPGDSSREFESHYERVLGTSLDLKILARSEAHAAKAQSAILEEIEAQARILSAYDASSEFSRWTKTFGKPVMVSAGLFEVLDLFDKWRDRTHGALDASAETITRVWKTAEAQNRMPSPNELEAAVQEVKLQHWSLDAVTGTAERLSTAPLVLNSFAKSYIVNRAAQAAMNLPGIDGVLVNIGGDLVVRGALTEQVEIADPFSDAENSVPLACLEVHNRAVATSGNYRRGFTIGGRHYSHIVDPRTGETAEDIVSSTVVAVDPTTAGALATAFSVMKPAESARLAESIGGVEYLLVRKNNKLVASAGWGKIAAARPQKSAPPSAAASSGTWDPTLELTVSLELARIEGPRVRRPYLAVWIEDQDKLLVRTVALWVEKSRYIPDLKAWYKDDQSHPAGESPDSGRSVSSATRPPGQYTIKWDGKDATGKLVKSGKYTVLIEAAREHGTYQLIHQEVDFTGTPKQIPLPGGTEIAVASLDYHKIGR